MPLNPKYNYVTTTNSQEDIEIMLSWLSDVLKKANISKTERNLAIEEEIRDCIRDTFNELPKNKK